MSDAQTILKLIEAASCGNREIDGAVAKYLGWHRITPSQAKAQGLRLRDGGWVAPGDHVGGRISWDGEYSCHCPAFSTSRDALKGIRPVGWMFMIVINVRGTHTCTINRSDKIFWGEDGHQKTEELAELYAIIKAIEYERGQ